MCKNLPLSDGCYASEPRVKPVIVNDATQEGRNKKLICFNGGTLWSNGMLIGYAG